MFGGLVEKRTRLVQIPKPVPISRKIPASWLQKGADHLNPKNAKDLLESEKQGKKERNDHRPNAIDGQVKGHGFTYVNEV